MKATSVDRQALRAERRARDRRQGRMVRQMPERPLRGDIETTGVMRSGAGVDPFTGAVRQHGFQALPAVEDGRRYARSTDLRQLGAAVLPMKRGRVNRAAKGAEQCQ